MKKNHFYLMFAAMAVVLFSACEKSKTDDNGIQQPTVKLRVASFNMEYDSKDVETWKYIYNANGKVDSVKIFWNKDLDKAYDLNYDTAGKIIVTKDGAIYRTWILNNQGYVSEAIESDTYKTTFEYTADGYLLKINENDKGTISNKTTYTYLDGNAIKYVDPKGTKEFTYSSGENIGHIYQAVNDSYMKNWEIHTGLFGKPCTNLNTKVIPASGKITTINFEFNEDGSPKKVTRSGEGWQEVMNYTFEKVK